MIYDELLKSLYMTNSKSFNSQYHNPKDIERLIPVDALNNLIVI